MKKILDARSPFWQVFLYSLVLVVTILNAVNGDEVANLSSAAAVAMIAILVMLFIGAIAYTWQIIRHNKRHPKQRIRYFGLFPPEFLDEDELLTATTNKATRRVYVYYATVIPLLIILNLLVKIPTEWMLVILTAVVVVHYLIYWSNVRFLWQIEDEE
ncbi:MAG: hypothetical protein KF916_02135 [Microbacteriaceae bacterium]|nr:hypothetical protein [Microbacteriaceae bacterium]